MSLETIPLFYFVDDVDNTNLNLNFNEGSGELTATVDVGSFSPEQLMVRVAKAMNAAGTQTYTVSFNRTTRLVTISAAAAFDLLIGTGSNAGTSIFSLIGFTGGDVTGLTSYDSNNVMGSQFKPQFPLQSYVDPEEWQEKISPSRTRSGSGVIETVSFGTDEFYEFNIRFATNRSRDKGNPIRNSSTGVEDLIAFMKFITNSGPIEIMKDFSVPATFDTILLETTVSSRTGTGYKLRELIRQRLNGYYETRNLKFSRVK